MAEIEEDFDWRGGMIQSVGIILGFALAFLGRWSLSDGRWELIHAPALLALIGGCGLLIYSMYRLTMPKYRHHKDPSTDVRLCTAGMALTLAGFVLAIIAAWIRGY